MKLLGWMHRKFRQNGGEPFTLGQSCNCLSGQPTLEDQQQYYPQPNYGSRHSKTFQKENLLRNSFAGLPEEEEFEYEPDELFHGLLAIGTLGSDPIISEPETPTFAVSFENVTEKETDVTENDLKLINEELEKVLGADAKDDSSGRTSRTSHVSSVTLSGNENGLGVFPLQGYLFGSPIGLPETTSPTVGKKEHRQSLAELFQKEKKAEKEEKKESVKKSVTRKLLRTSSVASSGVGGGGASSADSVSPDTKLNKILQMFHRKVHPENSTTTKKYAKQNKTGNKNNNPPDGGHNNTGDGTALDEDIIMIPKRSISKIRRYKSQSNQHSYAISSSDSNGNKEYWVKTDADYLVLEL